MSSVANFIQRWKGSGASERANYQLFLTQLCDILEVDGPDPASDQTALNAYTFERRVILPEGSWGYIDLYKRDCFVLEAKQGSDQHERSEAELLGLFTPERKAGIAKRGTRSWERALQNAKEQAHRYARSLPAEEGWPPLLIVVDVGHCIDLYADFSRQGKTYVQFPDAQSYRIQIENLESVEVRELLRTIWQDPLSLDPSRRSAKVTRELASKLARLATSLEREGHEPERVAHFLMRSLFSMFAEDVGLLPNRAFTRVLTDYREHVDLLPDALQHVWSTMDSGGFSAALKAKIPQFNGELFRDSEALPLSEAQTELLIRAAEADWKDVEPAIFGTLLERALDPRERHKLGAHFTPRAYVERLVMPTVIEPLREEFAAVQAAATALEADGKIKDAIATIRDFHKRLCTIRVLDPACGSGNFLYVTLEHLKRLEGEVIKLLHSYGGSQSVLGQSEGVHEMTEGFTVTPAQLLGIEINPRAAAIAEVVLWIGYLQWHLRTYGDPSTLHVPILRRYHNIECRDALIEYDDRSPVLNENGNIITHWDGLSMKPHPATGELVPDESKRIPVYDYLNARKTDWPEANFILGNPPFVGNKRMREALGDGYAEAVREAYSRHVPKSADFVMYWWYKAASLVRLGRAERFGLITTNSITQTFNRRLVEREMSASPPIVLAYAVPDHPWVDTEFGASVRIAMTVGVASNSIGRLEIVQSEEKDDQSGREVVLRSKVGRIHSDLTIGPDVTAAVRLMANEGLATQGVTPLGTGFRLSPQQITELAYNVDNLPPVIKPYIIGRDLVQKPEVRYIIDFWGVSLSEARGQYANLLQIVHDKVKPERDEKKRKAYRERWWLFAEPRATFRPALKGIERYIATCRTAKHRIFTFIPSDTIPDAKVVAIALNDAFCLGVLSSRIHIVWACATGAWLGVGNDSNYNHSECFSKFPFPDAAEPEKARIRTLAESLDAHRKTQLDAHDDLTMTDIYNVLQKLRASETLSETERTIHEKGLVSLLKDIHDELDTAVVEAYGWPTDLKDDEILERIVELNAERAAEESTGFVRYIRPEFQAPEGFQTALDAKRDEVRSDGLESKKKKPWPSDLPSRVRAVQQELALSRKPLDLDTLNSRFSGGKNRRQQIANLLKTLEVLGHVRQTKSDTYIV